MSRVLSIFLLILLLPLQPVSVVDAPPSWQETTTALDIASYQIDVRLDVNSRRLEGQQTITYRNAAQEPIPDLVFHLYLNAFRDETTLFMREAGAQHRGFSFTPENNGWIEVTNLRLADGTPLQLELLEDGTLARADLPEAVAPGEQVEIELAFRAQLPLAFARTGWAVDQRGDPFFMVGQWFPKLGVWQETGWNAHPFYNNAEFFANFGSYEVQITLPEGYLTGATGMPVETVSNGDGTQTVTYQADDVIDFAWTASPNFETAARVVELPEAGQTEILYFYLPEHEWTVEQVLDSAEYTLVRLSGWFGPYPYPRLTLLDVPDGGEGAGGMEYPTLVAVGAFYGSPADGASGWNRGMELVTAHEVAHQWWQSMVAFNEAEEPWLDEGLSDYSTSKVMIAEYGLRTDSMERGTLNAGYLDRRRRTFLLNPDIPMHGTAWSFDGGDYVVATYAKPNLSLLTLERVLGEETMLEIMRAFFQRYQYGHPTTGDFRQVAEEIAGEAAVAWFFDGLVYGEQVVNFVAEDADDDSITVSREGDLRVPVDIEVTFMDESTSTVEWPVEEDQYTFTFDHPAPIQSFLIDPDRTLLIELDWTDNDLVRRDVVIPPQNEPAPILEDWTGQAPDIAVYDIEVSLNPENNRLEGLETLRYVNTTQAAIPDLVMHLYLNAFENEDTIFMQEGGPMHRGQRWNAEEVGWIEVDGIRLMDGRELDLELIEDGTLARAVLPEPVQPGETLELELTFTAQLPRVFARTGWALDAQGEKFFMVGQWFPKAGVWTEDGWNAYPFHANAEFFADFGAYDVRITVPDGWVTGATGLPGEARANGDGTLTYAYQAEDVIDFAWTASPNFKQAARRVETGAGEAEIIYLYLPEHAWSVERALDAAEAAVARYSDWYGAYPYPRLTVVDVPDDGQGAGGMEYPTLITAGAIDITGLGTLTTEAAWDRALELVIMHEVGHQWWQSMVAFNEAEEPWLDEGFTDYSTVRALNDTFGARGSAFQAGGVQMGYLDLRRMEYITNPQVAMYGPAWEFLGMDYGVAAYSKPALSLLTLERVLGEETMLALMSAFFQRYQYEHPSTEDFRALAEEMVGEEHDLSWFFDGLVYGDETLNYIARDIDEQSITVERQGGLAIPTEIEVTFADGETRLIPWDGQTEEGTNARTFTFTQDSPVEAFEVDPRRKLVIELVWSDNGLRRQPDFSAWFTLVSRLVYRLQDWLLVLGGI